MKDYFTYVVCLGSNFESKENIAKVLNLFKTTFETVKSSHFIQTKAINTIKESFFTNGLVSFNSSYTEEELHTLFKKIEVEMGRTKEKDKLEIIPIDIDIIMCNSEVLNKDYYRTYIQNLLLEIK